MNCDDMLQQLSAYVDGEIDPKLCKRLEEHLAGCTTCRVVVDNIRKTIAIYKDDQPVELPLAFKKCLHNALREKWKQVHDEK